jgi:hypothetical protein
MRLCEPTVALIPVVLRAVIAPRQAVSGLDASILLIYLGKLRGISASDSWPESLDREYASCKPSRTSRDERPAWNLRADLDPNPLPEGEGNRVNRRACAPLPAA